MSVFVFVYVCLAIAMHDNYLQEDINMTVQYMEMKVFTKTMTQVSTQPYLNSSLYTCILQAEGLASLAPCLYLCLSACIT